MSKQNESTRQLPVIDCLCGCGKKFRPKTSWHLFFTPKCKHRYNRDMARRGKEAAKVELNQTNNKGET